MAASHAASNWDGGYPCSDKYSQPSRASIIDSPTNI